MSQQLLDQLLQAAITQQASDIYLTFGCPPCLRINGVITPAAEQLLDDAALNEMVQLLLDGEKRHIFETTFEMNTAIHWKNQARFRINVFKQQQHNALVIRRIQTVIPSLESLRLPKTYADLVLQKRGLILVVGPTGSGKSTSLASMIGHRNTYGQGHIITIEDPIEFVHTHQSCLISQRDVGIDTVSYAEALKNALRQTPDVILIGEARDRETMEQALNFAETGHLVLATLHTRNASQALERILNFFPEEKHKQLLLSLSMNLLGILAQRLVRKIDGTRVAAVEVLLNQGLVRNLIEEGKPKEIREIMEKNHDLGMQSFEQALLELYSNGEITEETALQEADNVPNLKLHIRNVKLSKGTL